MNIGLIMRFLGLLPILILVGCTTTQDILSTTTKELGSLLMLPADGNKSLNQSSDGWVWALTLPKDSPKKEIYINKPSIKREGTKVYYGEKLRFIRGDNQKIGDYQVQDGDYITSTIVIDCANRTWGGYNHKLYSKNDELIMYCPQFAKSHQSVKSLPAGSIIERISQSACR